jgi:hypothetical protein
MSNTPGSLEPAAAMHPTNPLLALSGGNSSPSATINNTTDGGMTWQHRPDPHPGSGGDPGVLWLTADPNSALFMNLDCCTHFLNLSKSTDAGVTWSPFSNVTTPGFSYDRPYIWVDQDPASPFYGRLYATTALFNVSGYFTVGSQWSGDGGVTWSPFLAWVDPYEYARMENADQFASLAAEPDGTVVGAWVRGKCCGNNPQINVPNKIMWTRSTDGGATFPISSTITTVPTDRSMAINSTSPGGFKWNAAPNIAADPVDGTLYAVWVAYRIPDQPSSAAVYIARGTPDGTSWTEPIPVYDNPDPGLFQYMPWVQVSREHTVHVSFGATVVNNSTLAEFYVQSTDRGQTFSAPFMLSEHTFTPVNFIGDYQAASVGGYTADQGAILVTWTDTTGGTDQWGRIGTFSLSKPTPTASATATATATSPATVTATLTAMPQATSTANSTSTATASPTTLAATPINTSQVATVTPTISPTASACNLQFVDVPPGSTFYSYVRCLACQGVLSGYQCGGPSEPCPGAYFRPGNNVTRGQAAKIIANAAGYNDQIPPNRQSFNDVPTNSTFWLYIERVAFHGAISGYQCGGPGEPCPGAYFRPGNSLTRGQLAKIDANAAGYGEQIPPDRQTFEDVASDNTFWLYIERVYLHNVVSGYECGGPGEPCDPLNRPYFRPYNNITRGQISKVASNTFFPNCPSLARW